MLTIEKHTTKELYRITYSQSNSNLADWHVATLVDKTCVEYQRCLENIGARPEVDYIPRNQWSRYQLWFRTKTEAEEAIEFFMAERLIKKMAGKPVVEFIIGEYR